MTSRLALVVALCASCGGPFGVPERELERCEPGSARCSGSDRLVCNEDGGGFVEEACPADLPCEEGRCRTCAVGSLRCGDASRERCAPEGFVAEPCPAEAPACVADGQCRPCTPGATRCGEAGREVCNDDGLGFRPLGCAEDDTCIAGFFANPGDGFTCVYTTCGAAYCWGRNDRGQLGDASLGDVVAAPVRVALPERVVGGSHGEGHACALTDQHNVYCWGANQRAQARLAMVPDPEALIVDPNPIALGVPATRVESGLIHSCAIVTNGRVRCWGDPNEYKLGWNATSHAQPPVPVDQLGNPLEGAVDLALTRFGSCAVLGDGGLLCWGQVFYAPFQGVYAYPPGVVANAIVTAAGGPHYMVVDGAFGVAGIGSSDCGQLGVEGDYLQVFHQEDVPSGAELAPGEVHQCVALGGVVHCFGDNRHGQLGSGEGCIDDIVANDLHAPICVASQTAPTTVALPGPARAVHSGFSHTCALVVTDGELVPYCFGEGSQGELGPASRACSASPVAVPWPPGSSP